ncbi:hypothetical protein AB4Z50_35475, partial [Paenibacillus sp. 2TAB26]|uniref:hypothetical protein n=1 Tax=Paenibacillus sp. 2TAB26 TaxID=3233005 RepID=UPI003F9CCBC3
IYSEYHYKDKRVDLAVVAIEEHDLDETPVAIFEFKYKSQASDNPFLNDVEKILGYINNENNCLFYLGFIQNAEFAALDNNFSWLNEIQTKLGTKRLIEMSGGLFRPNEDPIWSFKQH